MRSREKTGWQAGRPLGPPAPQAREPFDSKVGQTLSSVERAASPNSSRLPSQRSKTADPHDASPLRVVAMGGGNGLSALLQGLKAYARPGQAPPVDITAVVTVTDDGGSSGRLRRDFDVLPPGDIRNCMVALSEDSALLSRVFQYRFQSGRGLKGH